MPVITFRPGELHWPTRTNEQIQVLTFSIPLCFILLPAEGNGFCLKFPKREGLWFRFSLILFLYLCKKPQEIFY